MATKHVTKRITDVGLGGATDIYMNVQKANMTIVKKDGGIERTLNDDSVKWTAHQNSDDVDITTLLSVVNRELLNEDAHDFLMDEPDGGLVTKGVVLSPYKSAVIQ